MQAGPGLVGTGADLRTVNRGRGVSPDTPNGAVSTVPWGVAGVGCGDAKSRQGEVGDGSGNGTMAVHSDTIDENGEGLNEVARASSSDGSSIPGEGRDEGLPGEIAELKASLPPSGAALPLGFVSPGGIVPAVSPVSLTHPCPQTRLQQAQEAMLAVPRRDLTPTLPPLPTPHTLQGGEASCTGPGGIPRG
jgi:hypothetical protein